MIGQLVSAAADTGLPLVHITAQISISASRPHWKSFKPVKKGRKDRCRPVAFRCSSFRHNFCYVSQTDINKPGKLSYFFELAIVSNKVLNCELQQDTWYLLNIFIYLYLQNALVNNTNMRTATGQSWLLHLCLGYGYNSMLRACYKMSEPVI